MFRNDELVDLLRREALPKFQRIILLRDEIAYLRSLSFDVALSLSEKNLSWVMENGFLDSQHRELLTKTYSILSKSSHKLKAAAHSKERVLRKTFSSLNGLCGFNCHFDTLCPYVRNERLKYWCVLAGECVCSVCDRIDMATTKKCELSIQEDICSCNEEGNVSSAGLPNGLYVNSIFSEGRLSSCITASSFAELLRGLSLFLSPPRGNRLSDPEERYYKDPQAFLEKLVCLYSEQKKKPKKKEEGLFLNKEMYEGLVQSRPGSDKVW